MKDEKKPLPQIISEKQLAPILPILEWAYFKRMAPEFAEGGPQTPEEEIIAILADLVISLGLEGRPIEEKQKELARQALPEIAKLYAVIKKVGFSAYDAPESKWQPAVLEFFDRHGNFIYIRREDLENSSTFSFTGGQEKRDFRLKLLRLIFKRQFGEFIPYQKIIAMLTIK